MMKQNRALLFMRITLFTLIFSVSLSAYTIDDTIDSLIAVMSLDEKKEQLSTDNSATVPSIMTTYPNVRLGIPGFTMNDGPHNLAQVLISHITPVMGVRVKLQVKTPIFRVNLPNILFRVFK